MTTVLSSCKLHDKGQKQQKNTITSRIVARVHNDISPIRYYTLSTRRYYIVNDDNNDHHPITIYVVFFSTTGINVVVAWVSTKKSDFWLALLLYATFTCALHLFQSAYDAQTGKREERAIIMIVWPNIYTKLTFSTTTKTAIITKKDNKNKTNFNSIWLSLNPRTALHALLLSTIAWLVWYL